MKKIIKITLLLATIISYSQEIVPVEDKFNYDPFEQPKKYYKDVNGVFNKFIGTWKWQNATTNPTKTFEITFYKHEMRDQGGISYTDELYSKFKYIADGQTIYDTYQNSYGGHISGSIISQSIDLSSPHIGLFGFNSMELHYSEPIIDGRPLRKNPIGKLFLEYKNENNVEKLIWNVECFLDQNGNIPFRVPITMELIKQ